MLNRSQPMLTEKQMAAFKKRGGAKKIFAQALMPIRGPEGFRELDYDFANEIDPQALIRKIKENGYNTFGFVVKDTDGACIADTPHSWNPTGRDLCGEFSEVCEQEGIMYLLSVTNMNDAYRGYTNPETVSVHMKNGKTKVPGVKEPHYYKPGDVGTHFEGEMRVRLPKGVSFEEMKKRIPFLTENFDGDKGASRNARGEGYVPLTSFHCPNSKHIDYMIDLVKELVGKYKIDGITADYIRYHHGFRDFCGCEQCRTKFAEQYPDKADKPMKCKEWWDFREDSIVEYGKKFNAAAKAKDEDMITAWYNLPGPKFYSRRFVAQSYMKLGSTMNGVSPMLYPYLTGTIEDGWKWRKLADLFFWYSKRNMARRFKEYGTDNTAILCITNSVECNVEEMLRQMRAFDYGLGIALFKYYGTSEDQWYASKLYGEILANQVAGDPAPTQKDIEEVMIQVYEKYPPKFPPKFYKKYLKTQSKMNENK